MTEPTPLPTDETFIDFACPHCGAPNSFLDDLAGTVRECPSCDQPLVVPRASCEVGGKIPLPITTPRLTMRRFQPGDWRDLKDLMADEELFRFSPWYPMDEDSLLRWIEADQSARAPRPDQPLFLGLEDRASSKLIGYLALAYLDDTRRQAGLTLLLDQKHPAPGLGAEAVRALLAFGFVGLGLLRISASCDSRDTATRRMFEEAGLRREGEFLKDRFLKGEWGTTLYYALLKEEYESKPPAATVAP